MRRTVVTLSFLLSKLPCTGPPHKLPDLLCPVSSRCWISLYPILPLLLPLGQLLCKRHPAVGSEVLCPAALTDNLIRPAAFPAPRIQIIIAAQDQELLICSFLLIFSTILNPFTWGMVMSVIMQSGKIVLPFPRLLCRREPPLPPATPAASGNKLPYPLPDIASSSAIKI